MILAWQDTDDYDDHDDNDVPALVLVLVLILVLILILKYMEEYKKKIMKQCQLWPKDTLLLLILEWRQSRYMEKYVRKTYIWKNMGKNIRIWKNIYMCVKRCQLWPKDTVNPLTNLEHCQSVGIPHNLGLNILYL